MYSLINESLRQGVTILKLNLRYPLGSLFMSSSFINDYCLLKSSFNCTSSFSCSDCSFFKRSLSSLSIFALNSSIAFYSFSFLSLEINIPHPIVSFDLSYTFLLISSSYFNFSILYSTIFVPNFLRTMIFSPGYSSSTALSFSL